MGQRLLPPCPPAAPRSRPLRSEPLPARSCQTRSCHSRSRPAPPRAPFRLGNTLRPEPSFPPLLATTRDQQPLLPLETPAEGLAIAQRAAASALPAAPRCACGEKATGRPLRERGAVSARRAYKRGAAAGRRLPGAAPQVPGAAAGPCGGAPVGETLGRRLCSSLFPKYRGLRGLRVVPGWVYVVRCGLAASLQCPAARCWFGIPRPAGRGPLLTPEPRAASFLCVPENAIKQFLQV